MPPSPINPSVPPELEQTVHVGAEQERADRPTDADQLIARARARAGRRSPIPATSRPARTPPAWRRWPPPRAVAGSRPGRALAAAAGSPRPATNGAGRLRRRRRARGRRGRGAGCRGRSARSSCCSWWRPPPPPTSSAARSSTSSRAVTGQQFSIAPRPRSRTRTSQTSRVTSHRAAGGRHRDRGGPERRRPRPTRARSITLTVSRGPGNVSIPPVEGFTQAGATRFLTKAGLKVDSDRHARTRRSSPSGQAIGTEPGAGRSVQSGTAVALIVSAAGRGQGGAAITGRVPGRRDGDADRRRIQRQPHDPGLQHGHRRATSSRQTPAGGTSEIRGTEVTIVVAAAPPTASVPPVTGDPVSGAIGALTAAGLRAASQTKIVRQPRRGRRGDLAEPRRGRQP